MIVARLHTRHELPLLAERQTQGHLDEAKITQPKMHGRFQQAYSNKTATQPGLELNNYVSRRAYGHRTMNDLTAEAGQRGISGAKSATAASSRKAWASADNAAKRGDDIAQNARAEMFSNYQARMVFSIDSIPNPQMHGQPSKVIGEPDIGGFSVDIETTPNATIRYTPGSVETYLKNEGFIRQWVSYDHYDIYA
ncbi:MAG: hypothetical protein IKZ53_06905 [Selenomonadaceae bacterium]|nr:hypothetical protein [Selenomonadaceae bacterium]